MKASKLVTLALIGATTLGIGAMANEIFKEIGESIHQASYENPAYRKRYLENKKDPTYERDGMIFRNVISYNLAFIILGGACVLLNSEAANYRNPSSNDNDSEHNNNKVSPDQEGNLADNYGKGCSGGLW